MNSLVKRDRFFAPVHSIFDDFFTKDLFDWNEKNFSNVGNTLPSANVREVSDGFEIELAVPGMKKDDFKVEVHNGILSISSEKKEENEEKDERGNFTRREFNYKAFKRTFSLPEIADDNKINATYTDGILNVTVGKKEVALNEVKQIEVH